MTPEQIESERVRFEEWGKSKPYCDMSEQNFNVWLAAKQDSEQQRKELQERINHHLQY